MLNGLLKKKKKTDESIHPQVTKDEVGARLKGLFKSVEGKAPDRPDDNKSALKRLVASAAAEAMGEGQTQTVQKNDDDPAVVEKASSDVQSAADTLSAALAHAGAQGSNPFAQAPTFRDIGRDIEAHLETLRRSNADIQAFLNERDHGGSPANMPDSDHASVTEDALDTDGEGAKTLSRSRSDDESVAVAEPAEGIVASEAVSVSDKSHATIDGDATVIVQPDEASDVRNDPADALPAEDGPAHESAPTDESADDGVAMEAPSMIPDVTDIVEDADDMLGDHAVGEAREGHEDAFPENKDEAMPAYSEKVSLGDQIASMTPDEHQERLRRLEEMVTGGFEADGDDEVDASADTEPTAAEEPGRSEAQDAVGATDEAPHVAASDQPEPANADTADREEGGHAALSIPLMLSDEVMAQEDDTAAHELNAQICDFFLFDAFVTSGELSEPAFMGWSMDFFWRNAVEGGLARFVHLAIDRPEIWEALVDGLEAVEAESHLRLVEALQALLAQDGDLADALSADPAGADDEKVFEELDEALSDADEEFSLPHAMGGWLKSQADVEVLETEALRQKVSAYADLPELQRRGKTDDTA